MLFDLNFKFAGQLLHKSIYSYLHESILHIWISLDQVWVKPWSDADFKLWLSARRKKGKRKGEKTKLIQIRGQKDWILEEKTLNLNDVKNLLLANAVKSTSRCWLYVMHFELEKERKNKTKPKTKTKTKTEEEIWKLKH